jgi:hypothetical protein
MVKQHLMGIAWKCRGAAIPLGSAALITAAFLTGCLATVETHEARQPPQPNPNTGPTTIHEKREAPPDVVATVSGNVVVVRATQQTECRDVIQESGPGNKTPVAHAAVHEGTWEACGTPAPLANTDLLLRVGDTASVKGKTDGSGVARFDLAEQPAPSDILDRPNLAGLISVAGHPRAEVNLTYLAVYAEWKTRAEALRAEEAAARAEQEQRHAAELAATEAAARKAEAEQKRKADRDAAAALRDIEAQLRPLGGSWDDRKREILTSLVTRRKGVAGVPTGEARRAHAIDARLARLAAEADQPVPPPAIPPPAIPAQKSPTASQRKAATEAWKSCREQEDVGDASSCWRLWLKKHADAASEAERLVAEERAGKTAIPQAAPSSKAKPAVEAEQVTLAEGGGAPRATPAGSDSGSNGAPGVPPDETAPPKAPEGGASAKPVVVPATGQVLDFCALKPREDSKRFVKQRVIVFAPAGAETLDEKDAAVRAGSGASQVREVFQARFPLDRFYNVVTAAPGVVGWEKLAHIPIEDIRHQLTASVDPAASGNNTGHISARENAFVGYSLACADYVAFPTITASEVEWKEVEVKTKTGTEKVKMPHVKITGELGVFARKGTDFVLVQTVNASVPGIMDLATDVGSAGMGSFDVKIGGMSVSKAVTRVIKLPEHISALPGDLCQLKEMGLDGVPGLAACPKTGEANATLAPATLDEHFGEICKSVEEAKGPEEARTARAACEVRVRAFQLARALQKETRSVEGWQLFAPLQHGLADDALAPALSLGREEGLKVGYGFAAYSQAKERLAFFKVTGVGPGGPTGEDHPSELNLRTGEAPDGARLEEYPQLGLAISAYGSFVGLIGNYGQRIYHATPQVSAVYALPGALFGGGLGVGYDLSGALAWPETWLRIGGTYLVGKGTNAKAQLIGAELLFEKGAYLGSHLAGFVALGPAFDQATVTLSELPYPMAAALKPEPEQALSAVLYGVAMHLGFDFLLHPTVSLRIQGGGQVHFNSASYSTSDGSAVAPAFTGHQDHYNPLGGDIGLTWMP